ncbi:MAG: acetyltransferase-like isoleucine patch superfamily enzyme [Candidatus Azotimanducaceae bacterium]|jgi:acetyltransferase-like isoleucine patch superfamily enzyme
MGYLTQVALEALGFARLGKNVKISDKASIYEPEKMEIGDNCRIDDFCLVSGRIVMGRNVYIGPFTLVAGGTPGITLQDFATLAYHVQVFSQSDDYSGATMTNPTIPALYKTEIKKPVFIGRHSIVGSGGIVGPGVSLAEGTSVGAGAVVLLSTEPWSIYVGTPAKKLRDRSRELLQIEKKYLEGDS